VPDVLARPRGVMRSIGGELRHQRRAGGGVEARESDE